MKWSYNLANNDYKVFFYSQNPDVYTVDMKRKHKHVAGFRHKDSAAIIHTCNFNIEVAKTKDIISSNQHVSA